MHSSQSFLYTVIERVRTYLDEPATNAKYDNSWIVNHLIYPCMVDVLARINLNQDNPICVRHRVLLDPDQTYYQLPPNVQEIWRVAVSDADGYLQKEAYPRGVFNPSGPGWSIEGNLLTIQPQVITGESISIWYIPTGDVLCHYGTGYLNGRVLTLASSPTLGQLDRRPNAYAGSILRLLPSTGPIQERVIESHNVKTGKVTVRIPFHTGADPETSGSEDTLSGSTSSQSSGTSSGAPGSAESESSGGFTNTVLYEIAPIASQGLYEAISLACACKLGAVRSVSEKKMAYLTAEYRKAMKTIKDNLANLQMRTGKSFDKNTVDHEVYKRVFGGGWGW